MLYNVRRYMVPPN